MWWHLVQYCVGLINLGLSRLSKLNKIYSPTIIEKNDITRQTSNNTVTKVLICKETKYEHQLILKKYFIFNYIVFGLNASDNKVSSEGKYLVERDEYEKLMKLVGY